MAFLGSTGNELKVFMLGKQMVISQHPTKISILCLYLYHHRKITSIGIR